MPRISRLTVSASNKGWGEHGNRGQSTGTEVVYEVIPETEGSTWSVEEASIVALDVRYAAHKFLMADAQIRKANLPDAGVKTMEEYEIRLMALKETPAWKETNYTEPLGTLNDPGKNRSDPPGDPSSEVQDQPSP